MTEDERAPDEDAPEHRVKGEHRPGPIPLREVGRIVLIGLPVLVIAWLFLRWLHGGFR